MYAPALAQHETDLTTTGETDGKETDWLTSVARHNAPR
jgi:hypothetical protein